MFERKVSAVGPQLEVLWTEGTLTGTSDAELLSRFADGRGSSAESAFRELLFRHGSMVNSVCRQILRQPQDADDAFQATFLVLVRKARSIHVGQSLAPWLYRVAYRTAQRARASASRYRAREVEQMEAVGPSQDESYQLDLRPLLHEELGRLPEKYRSPIVLCHLEGKTHEEAARLLDWPVGTVSGRLSRGRDLLRSRLERRGLAVPSAIFAASWLNASPSVSISLVESTLIAALRYATAQSVSASVLSLTQGVLRTMLLNKLKTISLAVLLVGTVSGGAGVWARWTFGAQQSGQREQPDEPSAPAGVQAPASIATQPDSVPSVMPAKRFSSVNAPGVADTNDWGGWIGTASIVVVQSADGTALEAKSVDVEGDAWKRLPIPVGIKVSPVASSDTLALMYRGNTIDQLAAFSAYTGEWSIVQLTKPVQKTIWPIVGPGSALYQAGNVFYAYSAAKGVWDVLALPADDQAKATAAVGPNYIQVQQGNHLYVFSLKHGNWSKGVAMKLPAKPKAK
jgi:RNA polymerase sigma factor (sigma-70 family)